VIARVATLTAAVRITVTTNEELRAR
jgi:hypothetical protein